MIPPFVDGSYLERRAPRAVLADVRWYLDGRSGQLAYEAGHLRGAVFVDLDRALTGDPGEAGRHPLPEPEAFAAEMAASGIGDGDVVIAYDDAGGVIAARLVWMLRAIRHQAALLDGGMSAGAVPLETGRTRPPSKRFTPCPWPVELLAEPSDALDPANVVLDARARERFRGDEEPLDPRAGHIPGARSVPCRENLDAAGRLLAVEALRRRFAQAGVTDPSTPVVSYCGSGVTACHNLLVLEHLGLGQGRLYPGSWSQYSARGDLPVETGDGGESA